MRLVAWNCCGGPLDTKLAAMAPLQADIAVVPESPRLSTQSPRQRWFGDDPRRGVAVLASAEYTLTPVRLRTRLPRHIIPIRVRGPVSFLLIAVWAKNEGQDRYVRGVVRGVHLLLRHIRREPTVVLGDLNSNATWDDEHPAGWNHSGLVQLLDGLGLVSAYHWWHGEAHGAERRPTFFEYRHAHRPYHLDYCFLPRPWLRRLTGARLGTFVRWKKWSDHLPLICEVALPARRARGE
ncbi:MAG: hypothetical protein ACREL4_06570 [Gemmatimonadales bacterium]